MQLPEVSEVIEAVTRVARKPPSTPVPAAQVRSPSTARSSTGTLDIKIDSRVEFVLK